MNHIVSLHEHEQDRKARWEHEHREEIAEIERLENEKSEIEELIEVAESLGKEPIDLYQQIDVIDGKINFIKKAMQ